MAQGKKIVIRQVRSAIGRAPVVHRTLAALGLGRIGKERMHTVTPTLQGMLERIHQVVEISEARS